MDRRDRQNHKQTDTLTDRQTHTFTQTSTGHPQTQTHRITQPRQRRTDTHTGTRACLRAQPSLAAHAHPHLPIRQDDVSHSEFIIDDTVNALALCVAGLEEDEVKADELDACMIMALTFHLQGHITVPMQEPKCRKKSVADLDECDDGAEPTEPMDASLVGKTKTLTGYTQVRRYLKGRLVNAHADAIKSIKTPEMNEEDATAAEETRTEQEHCLSEHPRIHASIRCSVSLSLSVLSLSLSVFLSVSLSLSVYISWASMNPCLNQSIVLSHGLCQSLCLSVVILFRSYVVSLLGVSESLSPSTALLFRRLLLPCAMTVKIHD